MRNPARGIPSLFASILLVVLTPGLVRGGEGKIRRSPNSIKNEYIVVLKDDTGREHVSGIANRLAAQYGGDLRRVWKDALKGFFIRMNEGQAQGLSHHPDVKYIEENAAMFLSATVPTNVDPACDPAPGVTCATDDNRLWHLDVIDQIGAIGTNEYSYCETGNDVYVYVIDTGVMREHREFSDDPTGKVLDGYDASGDPADFPAWDPCGGPAYLPETDDGQRSPSLIRGSNSSHGTAVASLINGVNVGVARGAKVVPIKVKPCARDGARMLSYDTPNTQYDTNETVYVNPYANYYRVKTGGVTGDPGAFYGGWPQSPTDEPKSWGSVQLEYLGKDALPVATSIGMTVQMTVDGLDWILRQNDYPKSPAVVSISTYRTVAAATQSSTVNGRPLSLEEAIGNLLTYDGGKGITVVASANNQDADACNTSPARMSRNSPTNPNPNIPDAPNNPYKVITVGGTMLRNNPDPNDATGGLAGYNTEPPYDPTKPTRLARWRCHYGDSDVCSGDIYADPPPTTPDPDGYKSWTMGSNGGACVTLFAPAKNIHVANLDSPDGYRNSRGTGGTASGTSFSAPIVAGMVARILENNQTYTVSQVYQALMARTTPHLDPVELDPPGVTPGTTPNNVLQLTPVVIQPLPATTSPVNGNATITVQAAGALGLTYELYQIGTSTVAWATRIAGPQASNTFSVPAAGATSYFVRVRSSCGTADSTVTTVMTISAPAGVTATASGATVTIQWNTVVGADGYRVEKKISSAAWQEAQTVYGESQSSTTNLPSAPNGVVLYRVMAFSGSVFSDASNVDIAYAASFTDDPNGATPVGIRAEHVTELRKAVNTLRGLAGLGPIYSSSAPSALDPNVLRTQPISYTDWTTLMSNLNAARGLFGLPGISYETPVSASNPISRTHIDDVRNGLR